MKQVFIAYCEREGIHKDSCYFIYNGNIIDPTISAGQLGIKENDVVRIMC